MRPKLFSEMETASPATKTALGRLASRVAKTTSISSTVLALSFWICSPLVGSFLHLP
jgi:hypothetical protein